MTPNRKRDPRTDTVTSIAFRHQLASGDTLFVAVDSWPRTEGSYGVTVRKRHEDLHSAD